MPLLDQLQRRIRALFGGSLRENLRRLILRVPRGGLAPRVRGPVLGARGEAGADTVVTPESPSEPDLAGLYGIPHPGSVHPDEGALWFESAGAWTGWLYPDWQPELPHPPGLLAGNVVFENTGTNQAISWHWYPSGGPPGNAVKYLQSPAKFRAWAAEEQQPAAPGGYLSREILHAGKRLYYMPDHWACIGACFADNWLFMVGVNWSGRGRNWIYSGYDTNDGVLCDPHTTNKIYVSEYPNAAPDIIFPPGTQIRIGTDERVVQAVTGPLAPNNCWEILLTTTIVPVVTGGLPIEVVKPGARFGTYVARVFAVPIVTNADGDLEYTPGGTLYDIANLGDPSYFLQQFLGHPDGRNMVGMHIRIQTKRNVDIHRLSFGTGTIPPTANHTIENIVEERDILYFDVIDEPRAVTKCVETDTNDRQSVLVESSLGCWTCRTDPNKVYWIAYDRVFSGAKVEGFDTAFTEKMGRKIQAAYKSRTIAIDYDSAGNEAVATVEVDYQSTITSNVQCVWSKTQTLSGTLSINPYCDGETTLWTNSGQYTDVIHEESTFQAEYHLETDFSIYVAVNGVKKIELGSIQDDLKWYNTAATQTGYNTQTLTYEGTVGGVTTCPGDVPVCGTPPGDITSCAEPGSIQLVSDVSDSSGTIIGISCFNAPSYDYEIWPVDEVAYDIRHIATPLRYMDIRSGVYVTQGREGVIDGIYDLPLSVNDNNQMYPYLVQGTDYIPPAPITNIEDHNQHWAAWGVDFAAEAAVGSPVPTWVVIKKFEKKNTQQHNPSNWQPITDFILLGEVGTVEQGSATRAGKHLINVFVELPTAGQETLQAVELRNPTGDPLGLVSVPGATKITGIGAV